MSYAYTKVTISKEVAEALAEIERNHISNDLTLRYRIIGAFSGVYEPLQTLSITDLASALINGYEIEKSPEEKLHEYFDDLNGDDSYDSVRIYAIAKTLNILGITVEGINA